jgi:hypothetical protein
MVGIYSYSIFEDRRIPIVWCDNLDQITFGKPSPLSLTLMMSRAEVNQHHYFHPIQAFSLIWSVWHFLQPHLSHSKQTLNPFLLQKNLRFFFSPHPFPILAAGSSQLPDPRPPTRRLRKRPQPSLQRLVRPASSQLPRDIENDAQGKQL